MHPRVCVNGFSSRSWSLAQDIAFYNTAGIGAVTLSYAKFPDPAANVAAVKAAELQPVLLARGAAITFQGGLEVLKAPLSMRRPRSAARRSIRFQVRRLGIVLAQQPHALW